MDGPVIVGGIEFDVQPRQVIVGWIELDVQGVQPSQQEPGPDADLSAISGRARRAIARTPAPKTAPPLALTSYHSRSYEQDAREAAELDDEEAVIAFLMEYALT